ncbi:FecR family protein [Chitinophaga arvensicola]|uniref:FecR protein n=1 Tax=Chitinophaga arvensicola TaxID=29529 RepID=A0A1I0QQS7_9BACT|nr:FecR family protein [Chitinophaga arvensicola]SEW29843.1 FecR protein [Chitinophaga arvensicola]
MLPKDLTELDLLLDDTFLQYIRRNNEAAIAKWETYVHQHPEITDTVAAAVALYYNINNSEAEKDKATQLARLQKSIKRQQPVIIRRINWRQITWRAAAAILVLAAGISLLWPKEKTGNPAGEPNTFLVYSSEWGQRKLLTLPDGSSVILNANTTVRIPSDYSNKHRHVELIKGAALFDVKSFPDDPFTVTSKKIQTTVLGTSFLIKSSPFEPQATVSLLSGKVKVTEKMSTKEGVTLAPGEQALWNETTRSMSRLPFDTVALRTWQSGKLVFNNATAFEVIRQLESWYGIQFEFKGNMMHAKRFSGAFDNDKLEKVLNIFCFTAGCNFQIQPDKVLIQF